MPNIKLICSDLSKHPSCPHGPTLLFSRLENGEQRNFFACSACRDRKDCAFFLWQDELEKFTQKDQCMWENRTKTVTASVKNHIALFKTFNDMKNGSVTNRVYCVNCDGFQPKRYVDKHVGHEVKQGISDRHMDYPSEFLKPLDNSRKEAQYYFSAKTVDTFVDILKGLGYVNVLCIGAPRIHEKIRNESLEMTSLLLDLDKRFHHFFGPLDFCWYNFFNHHFFNAASKKIFEEFVTSPGKTILVTDPPFGGRIEPLADSINKINRVFSKNAKEVDIFWFFPYFMEGQIKNSFPNMKMMDYKVEYENHPLFKGRNEKAKDKFGSPVRIFTNVALSQIILPTEDGYKYCKRCDKFVSSANRHCKLCKACTSKDGRRYRHCARCQRCVKPAWRHCAKCDRCALAQHACGEIPFLKECFHCKQSGHKKIACPTLRAEAGGDVESNPTTKDAKRKSGETDKPKHQMANNVAKKRKCHLSK